MTTEASSVTRAVLALVQESIHRSGGWLPFDRFMALALYAPGLGYYANQSRKFGQMPSSGSDFVTAPEMSPLFGRALAAQVADALQATGTDEVWEFGAGSGALALQLLQALGAKVRRYTIVDLSGSLRARQQAALAPFGAQVTWASELPDTMRGVIVGNEVLDAMPVKLLARLGGSWHERGVALADPTAAPGAATLAWQDRLTELRPPVDPHGDHDYVTEIHPQADAFVRTLGDRLERGAAFFIDYGFPQAEYYHPQRHMGTLMCHRGHLADADPLADVGSKDITAHVNFTGIATAAQEAGLPVLGYTTQARFLINCGIVPLLAASDMAGRVAGQRLLAEHEMGELFKVIAFQRGDFWDALGFREGDRTHTL
ncbi:class I SAM-dependent methyltransferase [Ramlibacter sp.]|uniref:class I SAM-dependent methyltransferase n=1 Tax=Ramlibacter sp. TaxID=1917967 RepID=UPI002B8C4CC1|nr:SAM-dependent methyltransferase [Ramlibacter sp.]HWI82413.1 SAM-dependent methyltransferase [Ramlibacter sp.]